MTSSLILSNAVSKKRREGGGGVGIWVKSFEGLGLGVGLRGLRVEVLLKKFEGMVWV